MNILIVEDEVALESLAFERGVGVDLGGIAPNVNVSGDENQNHQLNWWYAPALKGHNTGSPLKRH